MRRFFHRSARRRAYAVGWALTVGTAASIAAAAPVTPPPRTPGFEKILIEPGETREARARHGRERQAITGRRNRDYTKDDTVGTTPPTPPQAEQSQQPRGPGGAAVAPP